MSRSIASTGWPRFEMWRRGIRSGGRSYITDNSDLCGNFFSCDSVYYVEQFAADAADIEQLVIQGV